MKYKITDYSCFDNYTVTSYSDNISNITDKLIRLTAKITEHYAGDIYYDIHALYSNIINGHAYDRVLLFREDGVSLKTIEDCEESNMGFGDTLQSWRLTHDPNEKTTVLKRVNLTRIRDVQI